MIKKYHFIRIDSTNDIARSLINTEGEIIVTTDEQTNGRGRKERIWYGEFGTNMYFTYSVNHLKVKTFENTISYLASATLFTLNTLRHYAPNYKFKIKYPNDIYCYDGESYKKVSGILIEHIYAGTSLKFSMIGIGTNINQRIFPDNILYKATSLFKLGINITVTDFVNKLSSYFEKIYELDENKLLLVWKNELDIINKEIILVSNYKRMTVKSQLDDGRLLLIDDSEELIIDDGESIIYEL